MRSLFGALCGLMMGVLVGALIKNGDLYQSIKEMIVEPVYLVLIIGSIAVGWIVGFMSIGRTKSPKSDSNKTDHGKNGTRFNEWESLFFLVFLAFALIAYLIVKWEGGAYIFIAVLLWIIWFLIKGNRIGWKFIKGDSKTDNNKNKDREKNP